MQRAPLLFLDEPTNHLDVSQQLALLELVRGLHRTVVAAVHDLGIARVWDDRQSARPYADGEGRTYWEIELDGKGIDLAYVYVQTPAGWENLALKLGLDATGVPRTLSPEQLPR